jgi:type IV pilus assembly protein PilV
MMHFTRDQSKGFSLIEVMVALIVVTLGLLGLAKMEALALSSADVSGNRALAAMQASSMAAMMHADHDYWQSSAATSSAIMTWNGSDAPTITDATLVSVSSCSIVGSGACTPLQMAGNDVYNWGFTLYNVLGPTYKATIICTPLTLAASPPTPVTCTITITWLENAVAANSAQTSTSLASLLSPSFTLNVQP